MTARVMVGLFALLQALLHRPRSAGAASPISRTSAGCSSAGFTLTGWWDPRRWIAEGRFKLRRRRFRALDDDRGKDRGEDREPYRYH